MERDGLVVVSDDRSLELTIPGRQKAVDVMRKHRLAERLLSDVIGLDWAYVHEEACRWEHVMSELVERRLIELLGHPPSRPTATRSRASTSWATFRPAPSTTAWWVSCAC
jgi:DtxR family Mn-dependent transcriptional regulator